jgi:hypothetical protein
MAVNNLNTPGVGIQPSLIDAKGDLLVGTANDAIDRLGVTGTTGAVLTADAGETTGLKWAAAGSVGGLVHINTTSVSAASIISLDNVFTTTYKFYRLIYALTGSTGANTNIKFRASGSDLSAASYARQRLSASSTSVTANRATGQTSGLIGNVGASKCGGIIEFFDPFATADKVYRSVMADRNNGGEFEDVVGVYAPSPAVTADGVSIIPASGNLTGFVSVYGFRN